MATNTNLGGVFTTDLKGENTNKTFLSTENVVGLIFDTSVVGRFDKAVTSDSAAAKTFANGNVVELELTQETLNLLKEQAGFICVGHGYYVDKVTIE